MKKFDLLTDGDIKRLTGINKVFSESLTKQPDTDPYVESVFNYYQDRILPSDNDENGKIIKKVINDINEQPRIQYLNDIETTEDGIDIACLPVGTSFYKATPWFFDTLPPGKRFWVGGLSVAGIWLNHYQAGFVEYSLINPARMFLLSKKNLTNIHATAPENIKKICSAIFGIGKTIDEQAQCVHKPLWLIKETECSENAEDTLFSMGVHPTEMKDNQHTLFDYLEEKYNCNGTIMPDIVNAFVGCAHEEITISAKDVKINEDSKWYWKNWGLKISDDVIKARPKEVIFNKNFKVVRWLEMGLSDEPVQPSDILSINVHNLDSIFQNITQQEMLNSLAEFVKKVKPKILVCQEFPKHFIQQLKQKLHLRNVHYTSNGMKYDNMGVAVFTDLNCKIEILKGYYDNVHRNNILLFINNHKFVFTHAPIGKQYFNKTSNAIYRDSFYPKFKENTDMRVKYLRDIANKQPDFIIGDMNFLPVNTTELKVLDDAGYIYPDNNTSTSIHDVKVDWAFYKPNVKGTWNLYNWNLSDHRPVGFTFDNEDILRVPEHTGGFDMQDNSILHGFFFFIMLICLFCLIIYLFIETVVILVQDNTLFY